MEDPVKIDDSKPKAKTHRRTTSAGQLICLSCNKAFTGDVRLDASMEDGMICNQCRTDEAAEEEAWSEEENDSSSEEDEDDLAPETSESEDEEEENKEEAEGGEEEAESEEMDESD